MDLVLKKVGSECLEKPSFAIPKITDNIRLLAETMKVKMVEWNGIGLAAPQVGHNVRMIVIKLGTGQIQEMINPRISWTSPETVPMAEGCLSIPGETCMVTRPAKVRVKFQTIEGEYKYWCLHKMDARVLLHEYDHLEGVLMTDKSQ